MAREKLPIARSSDSSFILNAESLNKILQLAGNQVETLDYLQAALSEKIGKNEEFAGLMEEVTRVVDSAKFQDAEKSKLNSWSGSEGLIDKIRAVFDKTEFGAFQEFMAITSANKIPEEKITLHCALSDKSEFIRAYYSDDDNPLSVDEHATMDTLFNTWLASSEHKMISKDGSIFAATEQGEVDSGKDPKVTAKTLNSLLNDKVLGFAAYLQKIKPGVQLTIQQHPFEATSAEAVQPS